MRWLRRRGGDNGESEGRPESAGGRAERARHTAPPSSVVAALELARGDRLLAAAPIAQGSPAWLLATTHRFAAVQEADAAIVWDRPWHEVDQAAWGREASTLTVTFVDAPRPVELPLGFEERFLQVLRERVHASVVSVEEVPLGGRRSARAVLRKDLATGAVVEQLVLPRGGRASEQTQAAAAEAFARLREEIGLPPSRPAGDPPRE